MAKKTIKKKKTVSRVRQEVNVEFNSWMFFIFVIFVLLTVLLLIAKQNGMRLF
jgi:hypothetical protein